jgi:hypothetical protein
MSKNRNNYKGIHHAEIEAQADTLYEGNNGHKCVKLLNLLM